MSKLQDIMKTQVFLGGLQRIKGLGVIPILSQEVPELPDWKLLRVPWQKVSQGLLKPARVVKSLFSCWKTQVTVPLSFWMGRKWSAANKTGLSIPPLLFSRARK